MVVYRAGILAVTGLEHSKSFICVLLGFNLVSSFRVDFGLKLGQGQS